MPFIGARSRTFSSALVFFFCASHGVEAAQKTTLPAPAASHLSQLEPPQRAVCGDGVVQLGEQCDNGNDNAISGTCLPNCTVARCGDGYVQSGESCDAGPRNGTPGSQCSLSCQTEFSTGGGNLLGN